MSGAGATGRPPVRVVKVGGSLLDWPPLATVLPAWLVRQPPAWNVLIAGGGELADAIRRLDAAHALGDEAAHWLCIDALQITARLLAAILGATEPANSLEDLPALQASAVQPVIFDPGEFLRHRESQLPGQTLPRDWSVTSDSIAARISHALAADELVLLKSREPPAEDWRELARAGYVDEHFPRAAARLARVRLVNLRGAGRPPTAASAD
jgi:aspartokinase-like uncharacterized kinase